MKCLFQNCHSYVGSKYGKERKLKNSITINRYKKLKSRWAVSDRSKKI